MDNSIIRTINCPWLVSSILVGGPAQGVHNREVPGIAQYNYMHACANCA